MVICDPKSIPSLGKDLNSKWINLNEVGHTKDVPHIADLKPTNLNETRKHKSIKIQYKVDEIGDLT